MTMAAHHLPLTPSHSLFDPHRPEPWVMGWDLMTQRTVAVPEAIVSMGNTARVPTRRWLPFAAGSTVSPAATTCSRRWPRPCTRSSSGTPSPVRGRRQKFSGRVDLDTVTDPLVRSLIDRFDAAEVSAYLFDITVDTEVPTYTAVRRRPPGPVEGAVPGLRRALDPSIAMIRALTEAAQARCC